MICDIMRYICGQIYVCTCGRFGYQQHTTYRHDNHIHQTKQSVKLNKHYVCTYSLPELQ